MNERIKELREQAAGFATETYSKYTMATFDTNKSIETLFEEKFAELLIKETIQIARVGMEFGPSIDEAVYTYFDLTPEIEYCPKCNAEWSGTSCGLDDCGWIK